MLQTDGAWSGPYAIGAGLPPSAPEDTIGHLRVFLMTHDQVLLMYLRDDRLWGCLFREGVMTTPRMLSPEGHRVDLWDGVLDSSGQVHAVYNARDDQDVINLVYTVVGNRWGQ